MPSIRQLSGALTLQNEGQLSLFPVGTGSAFSKSLFQNNLLIIKGDDHLLVDCGTRTPEAFYKLGLGITEVKHFLITHSHADHVGGLEEVILMGRYVARRKPHIYIDHDYQDVLWSQSMRGGASQNERKGDRGLGFADYWDIHRPTSVPGAPREMKSFMVGNIAIHTLRSMHFPDNSTSWSDSAYSIAIVINGKVLFTGDTRFDPGLIEDACKLFPIEAIFHDVQFFPGGVHAPFDSLKTLPDELRRKTYLMHYPDTWQNHVAKVEDAGFAGFLQQHCFYDFS